MSSRNKMQVVEVLLLRAMFASVGSEVRKQLWLALPMMGVNVVQSAIELVSVMFVGHLGELPLAGSSIATSIANVTGFFPLLGLGSALETLCGQAYGAKQYRMLGIFMQRAMLILSILSLPMTLLWLNLQKILVLLGQEPDISASAAAYARHLIPGLLAYPFLQPLNKFLQSQSLVLPMFVCSCVTLLIHTAICWLLVVKLSMGNVGAALAASISNWLDVILLVVVVVVTPKCRECWGGFSREAFRGAKQFLELAIPSAMMICLEWGCWQALLLLAGLLPDPELEASMMSILFTTWPIMAMFPISVSAAASVRVSNELGAGHPDPAKFSFEVSMGLAAVAAVLLSTTLFSLRHVLGRLFTNEEEVIDYVAKMLMLLTAYPFLCAFQGPSAGVVRGSGRQKIAAVVDLGAYYLLGLPLSYILAFPLGLKGMGLILGMLIGDSLQGFLFLALALRTDWKKEAQKALARLACNDSTLPLLQ